MRSLLTLSSLFISALLFAQPQEATLLGQWSRDDLVGSIYYDNTYNEVWGLAINGREYAVIGSTAGAHFIDLENPAQPTEVAFVPGAAQGVQIVHRDYHNYGCYLYAACDEGPSTLQIIDCSNLPESVEVVYDSDALFRRAHNIFIDTAYAKLYAFGVGGGNLGYNAMRIYDISDPVSPQLAGIYSTFGNIQAGHVHDGYVHNNIAYLNCGYDGFAIVDFSDVADPVTLGTMTDYPFAGYNHSGWITDDGQYYYLGDENHGYKLKILDVSDPADITYSGLFDAESDAELSIPHNQIVACNYLYVSYYYDGLQVFDLSDPVNPQRAWYYNTSSRPHTDSYEGAWGVYPFLPSGRILVSDMQTGLFVLEGPGDDCPARQESAVDCEVATATADRASEADLRLFPQPVSETLTIALELAKAQRNVNLTLLDINGQVVRRFSWGAVPPGAQQLTVDLGDLPPGMYLLRLQSAEIDRTHRLTVGR